MSKKHKNNNFTITFHCPNLNTYFTIEGYSPELEELIKELERLKKERKIIYSYPELFNDVMPIFDEKKLGFLGIFSIDDLVDFIYRFYEIRNLRNPEKEISIKTLRTILYEYKGLNIVKK